MSAFRQALREAIREAAFREIDFSPFRNNVLDYVGRIDLQTPNGTEVQIKKDMFGGGFTVIIGSKTFGPKMSNVEASYVLNAHQVGVRG